MLTTSESERALYIGRTKRTRQMHVNILNVRKYTTFVRGAYAFTVNAFENRRVFVDAKLFFFSDCTVMAANQSKHRRQAIVVHSY